jgi:hypothetical protein
MVLGMFQPDFAYFVAPKNKLAVKSALSVAANIQVRHFQQVAFPSSTMVQNAHADG